jgi:hypothetical protein
MFGVCFLRCRLKQVNTGWPVAQRDIGDDDVGYAAVIGQNGFESRHRFGGIHERAGTEEQAPQALEHGRLVVAQQDVSALEDGRGCSAPLIVRPGDWCHVRNRRVQGKARPAPFG